MEFIKIDKNLSIPLHMQLAHSIRLAIQSGILQSNDKLPTEVELGQYFNLSRPVVRQAYKQLIEERLIYRQKAKGSFVLPKEEHYNLLKALLPLTEKISSAIVSENIVELEHTIVTYNPKTMSPLGLNSGDNVYLTRRLYYGERRTTFYIEIFQPFAFYPKSSRNVESKSDEIDQIKRNIFAVKLDNTICKLIGVPDGSAGIKIESTTISNANEVIEFSTAYVSGYNLSIILDYFKQ